MKYSIVKRPNYGVLFETNGITTPTFRLTAARMKLRDCEILCMNVLHIAGNEISFNRFLFYLNQNKYSV